MPEIDRIIHQPVRLRIMAFLFALREQEQVDFTCLRRELGVTDGNLGAHLQKLEEAGYVEIEKTFVARKPRTFLSISSKGRAAFAEHTAALREIISCAGGRAQRLARGGDGDAACPDCHARGQKGGALEGEC